MRKALLPVAAILGWSVALAAVSSFDAMDAERDRPVSTAQLHAEPEEARIPVESDTEDAELNQ